MKFSIKFERWIVVQAILSLEDKFWNLKSWAMKEQKAQVQPSKYLGGLINASKIFVTKAISLAWEMEFGGFGKIYPSKAIGIDGSISNLSWRADWRKDLGIHYRSVSVFT